MDFTGVTYRDLGNHFANLSAVTRILNSIPTQDLDTQVNSLHGKMIITNEKEVLQQAALFDNDHTIFSNQLFARILLYPHSDEIFA